MTLMLLKPATFTFYMSWVTVLQITYFVLIKLMLIQFNEDDFCPHQSNIERTSKPMDEGAEEFLDVFIPQYISNRVFLR